MSAEDFDRILDNCLDRLAAGSTVADCLAEYPELAPRLGPLLSVAVRSLEAGRQVPSPEATRRARLKLQLASARHTAVNGARPKPTWLQRLVARPLPLAAVTTIGVVALTLLLVAIPLGRGGAAMPPPEPTGPTTTTTPTTSAIPTTPGASTTPNTAVTPTTESGEPVESPPESGTVLASPNPGGNFAFYLSDAPNDIGDFLSLKVTIDSIDLKPKGNGAWVRITGIEQVADLVQLQGDRAIELWRGDVPAGDYAAVFLNISHVAGTLVDSDAPVDVFLPSERLHVNTAFTVNEHAPIEFVFDITVHRTGESGAIPRYALSPQASESGAGRSIRVVEGNPPAASNPGPGAASAGNNAPGNDGNAETEAPQPSPGPGPEDDQGNAIRLRPGLPHDPDALPT